MSYDGGDYDALSYQTNTCIGWGKNKLTWHSKVVSLLFLVKTNQDIVNVSDEVGRDHFSHW